MHYIIAHRINGRLALAINSKDGQLLGSENLESVTELIDTACVYNSKYSPAILRFKNLYEIDKQIETKVIKSIFHFTGLVHYVDLKKSYVPDIVKYFEMSL